MFAQIFIEIHHLLNRSIKTGQQAVADTENSNSGFRFVEVAILFETFDGIHVGGISARPGDVAKFIVVQHAYHGAHFQELHLLEQLFVTLACRF